MTPRCWSCDAEIDAFHIEHEALLLPRETSRGGPLWILPCPECGTENGAERNAAGAFLLVPRERPGSSGWMTALFDPRRIVDRAHARAWFRENAKVRREFHAAPPRPRVRTEPSEEPLPEPEPETEKDAPPPADTRREIETLLDHYRRLGLPLTATEDELTSAYRRLSQKCHPDKVAHLDEEFQALASRKFQELRESYERILEGRAGAD